MPGVYSKVKYGYRGKGNRYGGKISLQFYKKKVLEMERFRKKIRVGVSVGDINGIGMEVIFKTFMDKRMLEFCTPVIFGQ